VAKQIQSVLFFMEEDGSPSETNRDLVHTDMLAATNARDWTVTDDRELVWSQAVANEFAGGDMSAAPETPGTPGFVLTATFTGDLEAERELGYPEWNAQADEIHETEQNLANGMYACLPSDI
jgi:hypothetical protein